MHKYGWNHSVSRRIRNSAVMLPCASDSRRISFLEPPRSDPRRTTAPIHNHYWKNRSAPYSGNTRPPYVSLVRQLSTTARMGSLSSIPSSRRISLSKTPLNPWNGGDHHSEDGGRRAYNRKAKHGSKKKKRKKRPPQMTGPLPPPKKLTLEERLALEDEQARQRLLYRRGAYRPPRPGITGQSRKYLKKQEDERPYIEAKWKRIVSICDYWFSDVNLRNDAVLRNILKRYHGYVPIKVFLSFPKFHYWTDGLMLANAFKSAEDRYKVRFEPNLWRPPYPPGYVRPEPDGSNADTPPKTMHGENGASTDAQMMDDAEDEGEEDDIGEEEDDSEEEDEDDDVSGGESEVHDDEYSEFDSDSDQHSDDEVHSDSEEDGSNDDEVFFGDCNNDEDDDDDVEDGGSSSPKKRYHDTNEKSYELDSDADEDGFDDGDATGWFDFLDFSRKDGHPEEETAQDHYDPGLSDDSEDEATMRERNKMWSNDNKYHVYNGFVRHRRVNLEYIETLEREMMSESEKQKSEYDDDYDEQKTG